MRRVVQLLMACCCLTAQGRAALGQVDAQVWNRVKSEAPAAWKRAAAALQNSVVEIRDTTKYDGAGLESKYRRTDIEWRRWSHRPNAWLSEYRCIAGLDAGYRAALSISPQYGFTLARGSVEAAWTVKDFFVRENQDISRLAPIDRDTIEHNEQLHSRVFRVNLAYLPGLILDERMVTIQTASSGATGTVVLAWRYAEPPSLYGNPRAKIVGATVTLQPGRCWSIDRCVLDLTLEDHSRSQDITDISYAERDDDLPIPRSVTATGPMYVKKVEYLRYDLEAPPETAFQFAAFGLPDLSVDSGALGASRWIVFIVVGIVLVIFGLWIRSRLVWQ